MREVERLLKLDPSSPARFDIQKGNEFEAAKNAFCLLGLSGKAKRFMPFDHADPAKNQELVRVAIFGPEYNGRKPLKVVNVPPGKDRDEVLRNTETLLLQLRQKYREQDYHIRQETTGNHPCPVTLEVWRGEDWLLENTAAFTPLEVSRFFEANIREVKLGAPLIDAALKVNAGRKTGTATTKQKAADQAVVFQRILAIVQSDMDMRKWSKEAQLYETIKRLRKELQSKKVISLSTAKTYASKKRVKG